MIKAKHIDLTRSIQHRSNPKQSQWLADLQADRAAHWRRKPAAGRVLGGLIEGCADEKRELQDLSTGFD